MATELQQEQWQEGGHSSSAVPSEWLECWQAPTSSNADASWAAGKDGEAAQDKLSPQEARERLNAKTDNMPDSRAFIWRQK